MKNIFYILFISAITLFGDDGIQFGGYLQNQTTATTSDTILYTNNILFRLEGSYKMDKSEIETHLLFSSSLESIDPFISMKSNSLLKVLINNYLSEVVSNSEYLETLDLLSLMNGSNYIGYSSLYPKDKLIIDRALLKLYYKYTDIFIGRQQIAWGSGYAFNPTDIWNMKNPLDPTAPKVGVDAIRAEIPLGILSNIALIFTPGPDSKHCSFGSKIKSNIFDYDYSFSLVKYNNADREIYNLPEKIIAGFDFSGQTFFDIGIRGETVFVNPKYDNLSYSDIDSSYIQIDFGLDYTLDNGLYLLGEYYYNGLGKTSYKNYNINNFLYVLNGDMAGFAQNYFMLMTKYDFLDNYTLALSSIINIDDNSAVIIPEIAYNFNENISISFNSSIFVGNSEKTEYGGNYNNLSLKVVGYF